MNFERRTGVKITAKKDGVSVSGVKCLDLDLTLDCGQAFRWRRNGDGSYTGVACDHALTISKHGDTLELTGTTMDIFDRFWKNYFALDLDYEKICSVLKQDELLCSTIDRYYGIRILNQDPWEALCSFVISQQNNIKRIKLIVEHMCQAYGDDLGGGAYSFPTAQRLAALEEADFRALGLGYRADYVSCLAKSVANGELDLDAVRGMTLDEARDELMRLRGVGIKVADCALLFGFGFYSAFPVDVWMKRVMEYYPNGLPECFAGYEGIAQQYLFHWARNNLGSNAKEYKSAAKGKK